MQLDFTYHFPTLDDEDLLKEYIQEHYDNGETHISASLGLASMNYKDWIAKINKLATEGSDGWGRSHLYMCCFNDRFVGLMNVRYEMDEKLRDIYGNIGYGVRPSERQMGFATEMLKYGLNVCKNHGLKYAVLGCVKENVASAKTMIRNGGQLIREGSGYKPGKINQYYKFHLNKKENDVELWDLYDKNGNLVGKDHVRGVWPIPDGCYHLGVHIWIKNSENKYLIAQRSALRSYNPLKWECHGGAVLKGENSLHGAIREVKEEVGIDLDPNGGRLIYSRVRDVIDGKKFNDFMDVWLFKYDGVVNLDNATTDEVTQVKWATVEEIERLYKSGEFVQTLGYFFDQVVGY